MTFRGADVEFTVRLGDDGSAGGAGLIRVLRPARGDEPHPVEGDRVTLGAEAGDWVVLPPMVEGVRT